MLGGLRAAQSTWIGKAVMGLVFAVIVLGLVFFGLADVFRGIRSNAVAQVGDASVSAAAYRQAYLTALQNLQARIRRPVTGEEAHRMGLDAQVLSRLMSEAALDDRAGAMDLAISDGQIAKAILADPSFAGPGGRFDQSRFDGVLRQNGFTEQTFVRDQRQTYLRQELVGGLLGGLAVPTAALDALHRYEDETRSLDAVALTAEAAGAIPPPDDAALGHYYDEHKGAFTAPQNRKLVVLAATPASVADPDGVTDSDARALYDRVVGERFTTAEKRHLQQIVFPTEQAAAAFLARVGSGQSFADALKADTLGDKALDLGTVARDAIFDRAVAEAAFGLPPDGTSQPVKGQFGSVVVHVDAIEPAGVEPFAEVAPVLKRELASARASAAVKASRDKVEDARSSGKTLSEAAAAAGLQARTIDAIDAAGDDGDGKPVEGLAERAALLKAAFASDVGIDNDPLPTVDGGTVWYEIAAVVPSRQLGLAEARSKVEAAWLEEEEARRLDAVAADLVRDIDAGRQTLEGAAASLGGLAVVHVGDAKRAGAPDLPAGVAAKVFDVPVGAAGSAATGPASRTLFKVLDSVTPPLDAAAPATEALEKRYRGSLESALIENYLGRLGARLGTKVNQDAVRAAAGLTN